MGPADVEAVWRIESARIVAALTRFTGDFGLAEDAAQEAVAEALVSWPVAAPANPAGWLMATARRRASLRRSRSRCRSSASPSRRATQASCWQLRPQ